MALTTTIGGAASDSYATYAQIVAHWAAIGFNHSAYSMAQIEAAARVATQWLDGTYRARFPGQRVSGRAQALEWPRKYGYDAAGNTIPSDAIPAEIIKAQAEATKRALIGVDLSPDVTDAQVIKRKRIGPLEWEYAGGGNSQPEFRTIEGILAALFPVSTGTTFLARA